MTPADGPVEVLVPLRDAGDRRVGYALIDPGSDWITSYRWYRLTPDGPVVTFSDPATNGRPATMAAMVLDLADREDAQVRHRNGNPLDHRLSNLEVVEAAPVDRQGDGGVVRSRYRRVIWDPAARTWVAYGYAGGRYVEVGRFDDEAAAARAARTWAIENQSIHLESDFRVGGFGRALRAPTDRSEAARRRGSGDEEDPG